MTFGIRFNLEINLVASQLQSVHPQHSRDHDLYLDWRDDDAKAGVYRHVPLRRQYY